jgi:hypothetical protein
VLVDPDGRELITMVPSPSAAHAFEVVKTSIATGRVVSVLGSVSPVYPLFGGRISRGGQDRRLRTGLLPWKPAIVTVLSQLTFANDTPSGGEFRDGMR